MAMAMAMASVASAGDIWEAKPVSLAPRNEPATAKPIEDRWIFELESGFLWKVTNETPLDYMLAPQIISVRGPRHFGGDAFGGKWLIRPQFSLLIEAIVDGPES